ncbi:zinc ribbon domain-containing protein [Emcibacter nanhaiensis]|uniref:Zinc ribbon domain-containing protein n=1 Tax=Emcibacter nanhaiensis TaxID=1505037 RepID=A0A501PIT1_9PROT|nr:zinc ribbon domain-containing protein [Emcibacter nanhaiensis]TPD59844.1 zinc ribbon domain-containing protein [Emcibacter nanhaiensis]
MILAMIVTSLVLGALPACVAWSKGRSFLFWWAYGTLFTFAAIPHSLFLRNDAQASQGKAYCPHCMEPIRVGAHLCQHCGHMLEPRHSTA